MRIPKLTRMLSLSLTAATIAAVPSLASADTAVLPLGDGHTTTSAPAKGWIYACKIMTGGGGATTGAVPWITGSTWNPAAKPSVQGAHTWPQAAVSIKTSTANTRVITTTGVPVGATTGTFPIASSDPAYAYDRNPNTITATQTRITITRNPRAAAKPGCLSLGPVGYATNGVAIFNALDGENRDAAAHEILDTCGGHPERTGQYHYHAGSPCLPSTTKAGSTLIGYALDGYGIYVERDKNGGLLTNADLDVCHGRTSQVTFNGKKQKIYHYVLTAEYPYTIGCYHGTPKLTASTPSGSTSGASQGNPGTGTGTAPGGQPGPNPDMGPDPRAAALAAKVVGMGEADAFAAIKAAGLTARIVSRDGKSYAVTMDFRPDRLNLTLVFGKVTKATLG